MSHLVPEAWHQAETRQFLRSLFESEPGASVASDFMTFTPGNTPYFMPFIAQYSLERGQPLWLVCFYGESRDRHVGAIMGDEGIVQVHSIDSDYRQISAVKLPYEKDGKVGNAVVDAQRALSGLPCQSRVQRTEANVFQILDEGDLTAQLYRNREVAEGPVVLGRYKLKGPEIFGRAADESRFSRIGSKFDPSKPEAAYYRTVGDAIPISPVTMAAE